ncbi:MAG: HD domain-containing protein [Mailhella sp.]|nr:HD domain-containing protein [Mailhella sp.]
MKQDPVFRIPQRRAPLRRPDDPLDISAYESFFLRYAEEECACCLRDPAPMRLKTKHTLRVLGSTRTIAREEGLVPLTARACLLAALLHDIARFEQYRVWGTFRDRESCDHGALSAELLRRGHVLKEEPDIGECVLAAVEAHNKQDLPQGMTPLARIAAGVVRDADRIDIMRVIERHLSEKASGDPDVIVPFPDDPALFSPAVIRSVLEKRPCSYADLKSANDFRLLAAGWFHLMKYPASRRLCAAEGCARRLIEGLPAPYAEARERLLADIGTAGQPV